MCVWRPAACSSAAAGLNNASASIRLRIHYTHAHDRQGVAHTWPPPHRKHKFDTHAPLAPQHTCRSPLTETEECSVSGRPWRPGDGAAPEKMTGVSDGAAGWRLMRGAAPGQCAAAVMVQLQLDLHATLPCCSLPHLLDMLEMQYATSYARRASVASLADQNGRGLSW